MPRPLTPAMLTAIQAGQLNPALLVQITFASATAYVWTGVGNLTWNSITWTGLGTLLGVEIMTDAASVEARGTTITLSGLDPTILSNCITAGDFQIGLPVIVYLGLFSGGSLITDPIAAWVGRMDQPTVTLDGETATVQINCESRLLEMNVACDRRYTIQDSQMEFPQDLGMQFVNSIQERTLSWGTSLSSTNL